MRTIAVIFLETSEGYFEHILHLFMDVEYELFLILLNCFIVCKRLLILHEKYHKYFQRGEKLLI